MANILTPRVPLSEFDISQTVNTVENSGTLQSYSSTTFPEHPRKSTGWCYGVQTSYGVCSGKMSALNNPQHLEEDMISPYLGAQSYSYSTTAILPHQHPDIAPQLFHPHKVSISERSSAHSSDTGPSTPVFLSKFKGTSHSKSPNDLRTSSALTLSSHPSTGSSMVDLPRTPTSGSIISGSGSSTYSSTYSSTHWSPEVSPRSRYKKKGGLLKRPFSPTPGSLASKAKGSKGHRQEEFDPTTVRKNRTLRRKNPQDLYDQYDDLFTNEEALDEKDMVHSVIHLSETEYDHYSGSDDGYPRPYEVGELNHSKKLWPDAPRSPPRSVSSPSSSHPNLKGLPSTSPFLLAKWKASNDIDTPPQSKPPSVTDLHQPPDPLYPPNYMPPTPPPPPPPPKVDNYLLKKYDNLEEGRYSPVYRERALPPVSSSPTDQGSTTSFLPGPPPGHAPPPVPLASRQLSSRSGRGSVKLRKGPERQEDSAMQEGANGLGILNVPSDTSNRPISPSPTNPTGPQATPADSSFSETATGGDPHRIQRKRVGSSNRVETLNNLMSAAKEISAHVAAEDITKKSGGTGYTPQMRIADVCDLDNEYAFAHSTDLTPISPTDLNTTKEMINPNSISIDTTKEVSLQSSSTIGENGAKEDLADRPDATPLRVFRQFLKSSGESDAFIQRSDRFDALQTQRICTHLRNDYQIVPVKKAKKPEDQSATSSRIIKQREVADKMLTSMWSMMSFRWMAFGRLLVSPAHELLVATCGKKSTRGDSGLSSRTRGGEDRKRVLDLGGIPVGEYFFAGAQTMEAPILTYLI